jgi:hypothetical protein
LGETLSVRHLFGPGERFCALFISSHPNLSIESLRCSMMTA